MHPIHTEAVASVVGRAEVLSALGFFAAWWCFLVADAARARRRPEPTLAIEIAGMVAFALAMLAKENAITLLPVLVFVDLLTAPPGGIVARLRGRGVRYAALVVVAVAFVVMRVRLSGELTPAIPALDNPLVTLPVRSRWMTAIAVVAYYALRLVFPLWLSADYTAWQIAPVASPLDPRFLAGLALLLAVPAATLVAWKRDQPLALGLGLMTITFLLIANLLFLIATIMAERWLYLPSAGFCLAAARSWCARGRTRPRSAPPRLLVRHRRRLLGVRTWTRNPVWRSPMAFFTAPRRDVAALEPRAYRLRRRARRARPPRKRSPSTRARSRSLPPTGVPSTTAATRCSRTATSPRRSPRTSARSRSSPTTRRRWSTSARPRAGAATPRRRSPGSAARSRASRTSPSIHTSLANVLAASGDRTGARSEFEAALRLAPSSPDVLADYGAFLATTTHHADAITLLRRSLALQPNVAERHYNLGNALAKSGALAEAVAAYPQALSLRPASRKPWKTSATPRASAATTPPANGCTRRRGARPLTAKVAAGGRLGEYSYGRAVGGPQRVEPDSAFMSCVIRELALPGALPGPSACDIMR